MSDGEVIPEAPWNINKRRSETYDVAEATNLLKNWDSSIDGKFSRHFGHPSSQEDTIDNGSQQYSLALVKAEHADGFVTAIATNESLVDNGNAPPDTKGELNNDSDAESDDEEENGEDSDEEDLRITNQHLLGENAMLQAENDRLRRQIRLLNNILEMLQRQSQSQSQSPARTSAPPSAMLPPPSPSAARNTPARDTPARDAPARDAPAHGIRAPSKG
jgi:hypothetical protein